MSKKVAVVCANGRVGKLVVKEAVERGLNVTAFVKGKNQSVAKKSVDKDLFDISKADLACRADDRTCNFIALNTTE